MKDSSVGKSKLGAIKNHVVKHKAKYITGGSLLLGFGLGFYFNHKRSSRDVAEYPGEKIQFKEFEALDIRASSAKIIGKFTEIDGEEYNVLSELIEAKSLIGSTSADVGHVELYYDNDGSTYAIAHDFESYYGKKS